jgi:hypothetical protein
LPPREGFAEAAAGTCGGDLTPAAPTVYSPSPLFTMALMVMSMMMMMMMMIAQFCVGVSLVWDLHSRPRAKVALQFGHSKIR